MTYSTICYQKSSQSCNHEHHRVDFHTIYCL